MKNNRPFYFDIHDTEVTPVVYIMFFALVEYVGNDIVYKEWTELWNPSLMNEKDDKYAFDYNKGAYEKRLQRGYQNCYYNSEAMKSFIENPLPFEEAFAQVWKWLLDQGLKEDEEFFLAKIW